MTSNEEVARGLYEAMNSHDRDRMASLLSADMVEHEESPGGHAGREGALEWFETVVSAFPDATLTVEDVICEGDRCACRVRMQGHQNGEFMGIPASRNPVDIEIFDFVRISEGTVVEHWGASQDGLMMAQIGAPRG